MPVDADRSTDAPDGMWLRRSDQVVVAALVGVACLAMAVYLLLHSGWFGRELIHIDRAEPRHVKFEVDINAADWPELAQLPGIGETLAKRIIDHREENGPFADIGDLVAVNGIGPAKLESMRPYVVVRRRADDS